MRGKETSEQHRKHLEQNQRWRKAHPEMVKSQRQRHYAQHRAEVLSRHSEWRIENPNYMHDYHETYLEEAQAWSRQYRKLNPEKIAENQKRFHLNNPNWYKDYEYKNRDTRNSKRNARRVADPEKFNNRQRAWCREHPEEVREYHLKRNGHGEVSTGTVRTLENLNRLLYGERLKCEYCGRLICESYHIDHVIALDKGGTNKIENLKISCGSCNSSKGVKDVDVWLWDKACKEWLTEI